MLVLGLGSDAAHGEAFGDVVAHKPDDDGAGHDGQGSGGGQRGPFTGLHAVFRHPEALRDMLDVGRKNAESALRTLAENGLKPEAQDILGAYGRTLFFAGWQQQTVMLGP